MSEKGAKMCVMKHELCEAMKADGLDIENMRLPETVKVLARWIDELSTPHTGGSE